MSKELEIYRDAWDKLTKLLTILDKAECPALLPGDSLKIMAFLLTSSVQKDQ